MKYFVFALLILCSGFSYPQKYILLDKKMSVPVSYTNRVTLAQTYQELFVVEAVKIHEFIAEVEKISALLTNHKKQKLESFSFNIGKTTFIGLKLPLAAEERMDVVITTNCDGIKSSIHLCDPKLSNANNAFFINTWIKYIKSYIK
jgi:hypothetical protein